MKKFNFILLCLCFTSLCFAENPSEKLDSDDTVFLKSIITDCQSIAGELELIRLEIGKPALARTAKWKFENANKGNLYNASYLLYETIKKLADQLSREHRKKLKPVLARKPGFDDVRAVFASTQKELVFIKQVLNIAEKPTLRLTISDYDYNHVLEVLLGLTQRAFSYLHTQVRPRDVFAKVNEVFAKVVSLRRAFPGEHIPVEPVLIRRRKASDVLSELISVFKTTDQFTKILGVDSLIVNIGSDSNIEPSIVYEAAYLLKGELDSLTLKHNLDQSFNFSYYPGVVYPAIVHRRVRLMHKVLDDLIRLSSRKPNILSID